MTTPKRPFPDAYLLAYSSEHVAYEIDMFFGVVELRKRPSFPFGLSINGDREQLNFALIESAVTHLRNIIDVLYKDGPKPTDVAAIDFFDRGLWETRRPRLSDTLDTARRRANRELAHLTTYRIAGAPPEKAWDFDNLANELRPILLLFVTSGKATRLSRVVAAVIR
jgi:hypothetical protein